MAGQVRVYIACSLDGFIAGPGDDLSWLPGADGQPVEAAPTAALGYEAFMNDVGALLMGRRTYDVVCGFEGAWPYGDKPVLVATHRPLSAKADTVRAVSGDITSVVAEAQDAAGPQDVYLDGGQLIRAALDAGVVDDLVVTMVPLVLGTGHPLFAGVEQRHRFEVKSHHDMVPGMVQLHLVPKR